MGTAGSLPVRVIYTLLHYFLLITAQLFVCTVQFALHLLYVFVFFYCLSIITVHDDLLQLVIFNIAWLHLQHKYQQTIDSFIFYVHISIVQHSLLHECCLAYIPWSYNMHLVMGWAVTKSTVEWLVTIFILFILAVKRELWLNNSFFQFWILQ